MEGFIRHGGQNFLQCGSVLKFSKITKSSSKGLYMMNKIFGLRRQIDSFVEVKIEEPYNDGALAKIVKK